MMPLETDRILFFLLISVTGLTSIEGQLDIAHSTRRAIEKQNDLRCYACLSMEDDRCINVTNTTEAFVTTCKEDRRTCMIKRYLYTTSTENTTSTPQLWALERNCTNKCEAGCIIIGERTKLYACTECCEKALCNFGKGASSKMALASEIVFACAIAIAMVLAAAS